MNTISHIAHRCTGCTACVHSCPKQAISMTEDVLGFSYPKINDDVCINCGRCLAVCPAKTEDNDENSRIRCYYGSLNDAELVKRSSSGGAFSLLAEYVLAQQGVVYGAVVDYQTQSIVYSNTDRSSLDELRRSKYVASLPQDCFPEIKRFLDNERFVLFCGLPCHVAGLRAFLKREYPRLITCDFICGGTASPRLFREHVHSLEKKYRAPMCHVNFRAKLNGWKEHSIKILFDNGKEYGSLAFFDRFFRGYFEKPYQRDSCYQCQYRLGHLSDIIIADYWGGLKKNRGNNTGVSMVITNSEKGDRFFADAIQYGQHSFVEMPLEDSDYVFKTEEERYTAAYQQKKQFVDLYEKHGFKTAARRTYYNKVRQEKLKRKLAECKNAVFAKLGR